MSKKYENIIKKYKDRDRTRIRFPKTIEDYLTNLSFDIKFMHVFLSGINVKNLKDMNPDKLKYKIDRAKMGGYQAIENLKSIVTKMFEDEWIGNLIDLNEIKPEPIIFKKEDEE